MVLEDLRQEAIDDYYAGDGRYAYSSLSVMTSEEEPNPYGYDQFYYYTVREPLSDETFNELLGMKYSELTIEGVQLDTAEVIKITGE